MDSIENHGLIIKTLRTKSGFSVQKLAQKSGRSAGWLSEVENNCGTSRLRSKEFDRIITLLKGDSFRPQFKTWVAKLKNIERSQRPFDRAVLKYIRIKRKIGLKMAAKLSGYSVGYLSHVERGHIPTTLETRNKLMRVYGYNPTSFKNLSTDPIRSKVVPAKLKLDIVIQKMTSREFEELFVSAIEIMNK